MPKHPPSTIRVCGKDYSVAGIEPNGLGTDRTGECDDRNQSIKYDRTFSTAQQRDTVLHELIHAVDYAAKLDFTEQQVHALSTLLYSVLADNPEFARWLIGK